MIILPLGLSLPICETHLWNVFIENAWRIDVSGKTTKKEDIHQLYSISRDL